ncbi:HEAT repeat domain-containing protein [Allosphingosinicella deserti]|nr:HEAT repeat domain-containing protein [Sphingomonas deserti]
MFGLLAGRVIFGRFKRAREAERKRLVPVLLGSRPALKIDWLARRSITDLSIELIRLVRGTDRERFVATATSFGVPERLRHRLGSGSARVRLSATEALAEFGDARSIQHLHAALRDRSAEVRLSAALALAEVRAAPPARELVEMLAIGTKENSLLTRALFREIAQAQPEELKALILDESVSPGAKATAIEILAASGDYSLVPIVARLASAAPADDPDLPRYLRALGDFGHPAGRKPVASGLLSPNWEVRAAAAEAAGRISLTEAAPNLAALLHDQVFWVRLRAGEALLRLGQIGVDMMERVAESDQEPARTAAATILAERRSE